MRTVVYFVYAVVALGFPILIMLLTNTMAPVIKFIVAFLLILSTTFFNTIAYRWVNLYLIKKTVDNSDLIISLLPSFRWRSVITAHPLEWTIVVAAALLFGYAFSQNHLQLGIVSIIVWWFPYDFISNKTVEILKDEILTVIQQLE